MADSLTPIEVFPPGSILKEELEARGWSQLDLAEVLGRPARVVNEVINGKRTITPETARGLGEALGTGAEFWLNLESAYQLHQLRAPGTQDIAKRAKLFDKVPVKEIVRRNWIEGKDSSDPEILEDRVLDFLEISDLEQAVWPHAARKSSSYHEELTTAQLAWLCRVRHLARGVEAAPYRKKGFADLMAEIRGLLESSDAIRHVPRTLAEHGIRLVVVEHLKGTKIDGVCLWLNKQPVIALSLRFDRIDYFWYTLMHELGHVFAGDGLKQVEQAIDSDLLDRDPAAKPESEKAADAFAAENLVPQDALAQFIARVGPVYSRKAVNLFAKRQKVHQGIVVGQLHHRKELPYSHLRSALVKVREIVTSSTLTDGWGHMPPSTQALTG